MCKCVDNDFPCQNPDYSTFDRIADTELNNPISASDIVNNSSYCSHIPTDDNFIIGDLKAPLFLKPVSGQIGLYHLWMNYENCDDHRTFTMECQYVGKGFPDKRIASHISKKWTKTDLLYVTFTPFENRLAKYYEQLFLDIYKFRLNDNENQGTEILYAVWGEDHHLIGTHSSEISGNSKMNGPADW